MTHSHLRLPHIHLISNRPGDGTCSKLCRQHPADNKDFNMKCEECENVTAQTHCEACGQFLCAECDVNLHRKGKRQAHVRGPVCANCAPERPCMSCLLGTNVAPPTAVAVYWEMNSLAPKSSEEARSVLAGITDCQGPIKEVRAYAQNFQRLGKDLHSLGIELVTREGMTDYQSLIMDLSLRSRAESPGKLLVLSSSSRLRPFLCQLVDSLQHGVVLVATSLETLKFVPPQEMQTPSAYVIVSKVKPISQDFKVVKAGVRTEAKDSMPEFHVWPKKIVTGGIEGRLLDFLKSYANQGKIMSEVNTLISRFQHYAIVKAEQARSAVQTVLSADFIHTTNRSFGTVKTVSFVSLKADCLSLELLLWTLRSLKNDEMLPTERAIQSRIKEAFDFKPTQLQWQQLLEAVVERSRHHHSYSASEAIPPKESAALAYTLPNFIVLDVMDALTNQETKVVYPDGERWIALDNNLKVCEAQALRESEEWRVFVSFLEGYFAPEEAKQAWRKAEEDKAISGGRYGCAQFLKYCGPTSLQSCSLGKLSFMVQLAINEDLLRYQKTLLVWTPGSAKPTNEELAAERLRQVQQAVLEALRESSEGVSLAQLPMKVRALLPFPLDLSELGFAKLKDLLATIPAVRVELRGSNHPFAVFNCHSAKTSASDTDALLSAIKAIVSESHQPTPVAHLEVALAQRLGRAVNWNSFDCSNAGDFAKRMSGGSLEVFRQNDTSVVRASWQSHSDANAFYQQIPTQKVVTVSDLPEEFRREWEGEEQHRRYLEELVGEGRMQQERLLRSDSSEYQLSQFSYAEWLEQDGQTYNAGSYLESPPGL